MSIELSSEAAIRDLVRVFRERNLPLPRKVTLTYHEYEELKKSVEAVMHYSDPLNMRERDNDSMVIHGLLVDRIPCTCGAL